MGATEEITRFSVHSKASVLKSALSFSEHILSFYVLDVPSNIFLANVRKSFFSFDSYRSGNGLLSLEEIRYFPRERAAHGQQAG